MTDQNLRNRERDIYRWSAFTDAERRAIHDGLTGEAHLDPNEDPSFPARIDDAERMIEEIVTYEAVCDG